MCRVGSVGNAARLSDVLVLPPCDQPSIYVYRISLFYNAAITLVHSARARAHIRTYCVTRAARVRRFTHVSAVKYLEFRTARRVKYLRGLSAPIYDMLSKTCAVILNSRRALVPRRNFCSARSRPDKDHRDSYQGGGSPPLSPSRARGDISICPLCVRKRDTRCNRANTRDHACPRRPVRCSRPSSRLYPYTPHLTHTHTARIENGTPSVCALRSSRSLINGPAFDTIPQRELIARRRRRLCIFRSRVAKFTFAGQDESRYHQRSCPEHSSRCLDNTEACSGELTRNNNGATSRSACHESNNNNDNNDPNGERTRAGDAGEIE